MEQKNIVSYPKIDLSKSPYIDHKTSYIIIKKFNKI